MFTLLDVSVTVMVLLVPSSPFCPAVPVHVTVPEAVAGDGVHVIPERVTVDPASTPERERVTVVPELAGDGEILITLGVDGGVVS